MKKLILVILCCFLIVACTSQETKPIVDKQPVVATPPVVQTNTTESNISSPPVEPPVVIPTIQMLNVNKITADTTRFNDKNYVNLLKVMLADSVDPIPLTINVTSTYATAIYVYNETISCANSVQVVTFRKKFFGYQNNTLCLSPPLDYASSTAFNITILGEKQVVFEQNLTTPSYINGMNIALYK